MSARDVAGMKSRSGRAMRGCEAMGSDGGTLREIKEALKQRDARRGFVPQRKPFMLRKRIEQSPTKE